MKAKRNWLIKEAEKADSKKNVVILENPDVRDYLDRLLLENFWPVISSCLEESGYDYSPEPEIESELSYTLERALSFMLLDGKRTFFSGTLKVSIEAWMLESNFFLPLSKDTDARLVFQILGNSRFAGYPPTLIIDKERADSFYQVDFHSGNGADWGFYNEDYIQEKIRKTINVNKDMYEFSIEEITAETIGEFLSLAYEVYEAF